MEILRLLEDCPFVKSYEVLEHKTWQNGSYIKLNVLFKDNSTLYIREYISPDERFYSFHWQDKMKELICRWDNSIHHKKIITFPHHKHVGKETMPSREITLEEILESIVSKIKMSK